MAKESSRGWSMTLGPCTHVGDPKEVSGSQLQISPTLAMVAIWELNQQMEDLSLRPPPISISISISSISILPFQVK